MCNFILCQSSLQFNPPLDIPLFLSGSFGELRKGSFHAGIDLRTQGVIRKRVFSIDDGYVSRIRIQTGGYGKALYIDHPGGFTSVYAHLDNYNDIIDSYIKNIQYEKKSHTVEIFPEKTMFPVKKGDFIAFSGNTGSSGGPHLHFEIRETKGQIPLNPLLISNFNITDKTRPVLHTLAVYPLDSVSQVNSGNAPVYFPLEKSDKGVYKISGNQSISISGKTGFGLETFDFLDGSSIRCGVYSIEIRMREKTIYHFVADKFPYSESRYVNAHIDYPAQQKMNKRINLLFRKPNNRLSLYKTLVYDGIIKLNPAENQEMKIIVRDAAGNESTLTFIATGVEHNPVSKAKIPGYAAVFRWTESNSYKDTNSRIFIPQGALYEDILFKYSVSDTKHNFYPFYHFIHDSITPIHRQATLSLKADAIPEKYRNKTVITKINNNGKNISHGGTWENDWIRANISEFGVYSLDIDTIPPIIKPVNIFYGKNMKDVPSIRFTVEDNLSDINSYYGYIDNKWVLFEYDPKNKLLFYTFDKQRLQKDKDHELELYVTDGTGNMSSFHTVFTW